jgi:hypothetical protein
MREQYRRVGFALMRFERKGLLVRQVCMGGRVVVWCEDERPCLYADVLSMRRVGRVQP